MRYWPNLLDTSNASDTSLNKSTASTHSSGSKRTRREQNMVSVLHVRTGGSYSKPGPPTPARTKPGPNRSINTSDTSLSNVSIDSQSMVSEANNLRLCVWGLFHIEFFCVLRIEMLRISLSYGIRTSFQVTPSNKAFRPSRKVTEKTPLLETTNQSTKSITSSVNRTAGNRYRDHQRDFFTWIFEHWHVSARFQTPHFAELSRIQTEKFN